MTMNLRINRAGEFDPPHEWTLGPERTCAWEDLDLWYLCAGRGYVDTPDGQFALIPGCCLLMRGGEAYEFFPEAGHSFRHYWIHFDCLDERGHMLANDRLILPARFHASEESAFLEGLVSRVVKAYWAEDQRVAALWLQAALCELQARELRGVGHQARDHQLERVERLRGKIDAEPQRDWSMEHLCQEFAGCRSHVYRAFVAYLGCSPQQYIIEARMRRARMLLTESGNNIGWIADQLGYRDVYFFSRQFKRVHGCSPSEYRRRQGAGSLV